MEFWNKVRKCKHENLSPTYYEFLNCPTPFCSAQEEHCLDCGVYITKCACGFLNGMSGWSARRRRNLTEIKTNKRKRNG